MACRKKQVIKSKGIPPETVQRFFAPKKFPRGLVTEGQIVFEIDPLYKTDINTHGVGKAFGTIEDPNVGSQVLVKWHDNPKNPEVMEKKDLKLAPQIDQEFIYEDDLVKCVQYKKKRLNR